MNDFEEYFQAGEPGRRERAEAWATAIGLQQVDGLVPSQFLFNTAIEHIEGRITQNQARRRIRDYYAAQGETTERDPDKEEADKVSERIVAVINDGGFEFTPEYYISIHAKLFKGVLTSAGKLRTVNIRKREWVLKDDSVTYGSADTIKQSLIRDFIDEREFDYSGKSPRQAIPHFARFIAQIWQVHPFGEGNTRTTAVFAIKYLNSLGYRVSGQFVVLPQCARPRQLRRLRARRQARLELSGSVLPQSAPRRKQRNEEPLSPHWPYRGRQAQDSRTVGRQADGRLSEKGCQKKVVRKRLSENGSVKTADKLLTLLKGQPHLTQEGMARAMGISRQAIQKHLARFKASGRLRRVGPDKGGHWEVV